MTEAGWTRDKPQVAGWYWWRRPGFDVSMLNVYESPIGLRMWLPGEEEKGESIAVDRSFDDTEFLGPLSPTDRQQGRVGACEWKYDDMGDYYETACKHAYCLADGTLKDNKHKYCPYCGGLIQLAQAAQDEKGVGDVLK